MKKYIALFLAFAICMGSFSGCTYLLTKKVEEDIQAEIEKENDSDSTVLENDPAASTDKPTAPSVDEPTNPGVDEPANPGVDEPTEPGTDEPTDPGVDEPTDPGTDEPTEPGVDEPTNPGVDEPTDPSVDDPNDLIYLPEADENTVELTIEIPQEFIDKEYDIYTFPETVSNEDFEWGDYALFSRYVHSQTTNAALATATPNYYIFSSESKTMPEAKALYDKFNNKYLLEYEGERTASNYEENLPSEYIDYLYNSHIVCISPEADIFERYYFLAEDSYWRLGAWDTLYTLFENGNVTLEKKLKIFDIGRSFPFTTLYNSYAVKTKYRVFDSDNKHYANHHLFPFL